MFIATYYFFIVLRHRSWGAPFGEPQKLTFLIQYKKKLIISGDLFFLLKRFRNFRHPGLLLPKGNYVYNIQLPLYMTRTQFLAELHTYNIGPQWKYSSIVSGTLPISIVFIAKQYFFVVLRHRSWGGPFGEPQKLIFLIQYKKKLVILGDLFFLLKRSSWGISDIQGCCSPKGIVYIKYIPLYMKETQFLPVRMIFL